MLKGEYVALRAIEEYDLIQLMTWRNNPEFRKFFRETSEINMINQEKWFSSIIEKNSLNKMFSIIKLDTNELIGACGLCYIDWINRSADFSIYIGYNDLYIDEKYAIDAGKLMMSYGFNILNLHRLWAEIYSFDNKKKKFFNHLGFIMDGKFRDTYWFNGKWNDSLFFSYLSRDYFGNNK